MRYIKLPIIAAVAGWLVFELIVNLQHLKQSAELAIGLPWYPLGTLVMPLWMLMLACVLLAFTVAVFLEVVAWYEYARTIRLQRRQIMALKDELEKNKRRAA